MGFREDQRILYNATISDINKRNELILAAYEKSLKNIQTKIVETNLKYIKGEIITDVHVSRTFRLQELYKQIDNEATKLRAKLTKVIYDGYIENFTSSYYYVAYIFEKSINTELSLGSNYILNYPVLNTRAIEASFNPAIGDMIQNLSTSFKASTKQFVANSVIDGKSVNQLAKELMTLDEIAKEEAWKAQRIARTELLKAYSLGQEEASRQAEESGIEIKYIWKATLDSKTRGDHVAQDNKVAIIVNGGPVFTVGSVKLSGPRVVSPLNTAGQKEVARQVINCRCRRIEAPFGIDPTKRVAKKPDGTWIDIDGNTSAVDWISNNYPKARVKNINIGV